MSQEGAVHQILLAELKYFFQKKIEMRAKSKKSDRTFLHNVSLLLTLQLQWHCKNNISIFEVWAGARSRC